MADAHQLGSRKRRMQRDENQLELSKSLVESPLRLRSRTAARKQVASIGGVTITTPTVEVVETPRRSARKSIKPTQDYDEIIVQRGLNSRSKLDANVTVATDDDTQEKAPKWTPAKVGRVSQRRSRRAKSSAGKRKHKMNKSTIVMDESDKENEGYILEELTKAGEEITNKKTAKNSEINYKTFDAEEVSNKKTVNNTEIGDKSVDTEEIGSEASEKANDDIVDSEIKNPSTANLSKIDAISNDKEEFGYHLKIDDFNISDLGLMPINDDDSTDYAQEGEVVCKQKSEPIVLVETSEAIVESMSSSDKEDKIQSHTHDSADVKENLSANDDDNENVKNNTSNSSDCILLDDSLNVVEDEDDEEECFMELLQISDDEIECVSEKKTPIKPAIPKLLLTDEGGLNKSISLSPHSPLVVPNIKQKVNFCESPKIKLSPLSSKSVAHIVQQNTDVSVTPKTQSVKRYRFPTPYKMPANFKFEDNDSVNKNNEVEEKTNAEQKSLDANALTTMQPKEIIIRSIRKRSKSLSITGKTSAKKIRERVRVTFYSPANQTTVIEDFDELIANKLKNAAEKDGAENTASINTRRPRSASFDETQMENNRKVLTDVDKSAEKTLNTSRVPKRTKLLNFAAIHQRQFDKMENLFDHIARKAERAKTLTSSSTKKPKIPLKPSAGTAQNATAAKKNLSTMMSKSMLPVTKATKQISKPIAKVNPIRDAKAAVGSDNDDEFSRNSMIIRNNPQLMLIQTAAVTPVKPAVKTNIPKPVRTITKSAMEKQKPLAINVSTTKIRTPGKKENIQRPAFNLSTHVPKPIAIKPKLAAPAISAINTTKFTIGAPTTTTTTRPATAAAAVSTAGNTTFLGKVVDRQQRHIDMYKGRTGSSRSEKNKEVLRGVRSNRRFDLQMQHRRNMELN